MLDLHTNFYLYLRQIIVFVEKTFLSIMILVKILTIVSVISGVVNAFEITDCSGKDALAKLDKVTIGGCSVGTPDKYCPLIRGQTASIDVDFETGTLDLS